MAVVKKLTTQRSDIPRGVKVLAFMFILFLLAARKKAITTRGFIDEIIIDLCYVY
jgi:hypothetical protein